MPVVPGQAEALNQQFEEAQKKRPTPEHLLMAAADMHSRGQLIQQAGAPGSATVPSGKPTKRGVRSGR